MPMNNLSDSRHNHDEINTRKNVKEELINPSDMSFSKQKQNSHNFDENSYSKQNHKNLNVSPNSKVPKIQNFIKAVAPNDKANNPQRHQQTGYSKNSDNNKQQVNEYPSFNMEKNFKESPEKEDSNLHDSRIQS